RIVLHAPAGQQAWAASLAREGELALDAIGRATGLDLGGDIAVFVVADEVEFVRRQPGTPPRWADATAWPAQGWVFLRAPSLRGPDAAPLSQVFAHELVHVVVGRAFAPMPAPRWLQEGLAQSLSGERDLAPRPTQASAPSLAAVTAHFEGDPHAADAAYVASADLVRWLERRLGPPGFGAVLRAVADGRSLSGALLDATGEGMPALEAAWRSSLPLGAWWSHVQLDTAAWTVAAALVAARAWTARQGRPTSYRRYAEEERALAALAVAVLAARGRASAV
ncbi:MAG: hypothetical protein RLZZ383_2629, partial [Pseudomonadota bacterium]